MSKYKIVTKNLESLSSPEKEIINYGDDNTDKKKQLKGIIKDLNISKEEIDETKKSLNPDKLYNL